MIALAIILSFGFIGYFLAVTLGINTMGAVIITIILLLMIGLIILTME